MENQNNQSFHLKICDPLFFSNWFATDLGGRGGRPVEEGAKGIVWAATLPDSGPSGGFFYDGKPEPW